MRGRTGRIGEDEQGEAQKKLYKKKYLQETFEERRANGELREEGQAYTFIILELPTVLWSAT